MIDRITRRRTRAGGHVGFESQRQTRPPRELGRSATHPVTHRTFKIATVFSTVMLAISLLLFLAGYVVSPWDYHLSFQR